MAIGISLFLTMLLMALMAPDTLGWFAGTSMAAGVMVAAWLSRRACVQQLFVKAEEPSTIKVESRGRIFSLDGITSTAAVALGILIGYLLANLVLVQLHAKAIAAAAMMA